MSEITFRILLIERESTWVNKLKSAIEEEGHSVDLIHDLTQAPTHLTQPRPAPAAPYDVAIVADDNEGSAGSSLFQTLAEQMPRETQPAWAINKLIGISGVPRQNDLTQALEHQNVLRNLGVHAFIYRGENIGQCMAILSGLLYRERRADVRISVKYKLRATLIGPASEGSKQQTVDGTMVDLCLSGAQIVLRRWAQLEEIALGTQLVLSWRSPYDQSIIECNATIRRLRPQRSIFGHRLALGVQFVDTDPNVRGLLRMLIDYENEMQAINRLAAMGLQPESVDFEKFQRLHGV